MHEHGARAVCAEGAEVLLKLSMLQRLNLRKHKLQPVSLPNGVSITPAAWTDKSVSVLLRFMEDHALRHQRRSLKVIVHNNEDDGDLR